MQAVAGKQGMITPGEPPGQKLPIGQSDNKGPLQKYPRGATQGGSVLLCVCEMVGDEEGVAVVDRVLLGVTQHAKSLQLPKPQQVLTPVAHAQKDAAQYPQPHASQGAPYPAEPA